LAQARRGQLEPRGVLQVPAYGEQLVTAGLAVPVRLQGALELSTRPDPRVAEDAGTDSCRNCGTHCDVDLSCLLARLLQRCPCRAVRPLAAAPCRGITASCCGITCATVTCRRPAATPIIVPNLPSGRTGYPLFTVRSPRAPAPPPGRMRRGARPLLVTHLGYGS